MTEEHTPRLSDLRRLTLAFPNDALERAAWISVAIALVLEWWVGSIPGRGSFLFSVVAGLPLFVATALLLALGIRSLIRKKLPRTLVQAGATLIFGLLITSSGLPLKLHWPLIEARLAAAERDGSCPAFAGLAPVQGCTELLEKRGYDFGGGLFLNSFVVMHVGEASGVPGGGVITERLADGWAIVRLP